MSELNTKVTQSAFISSKGNNLARDRFCDLFRKVKRSKIVNTDRKSKTDLFSLSIKTINYILLIDDRYQKSHNRSAIQINNKT
ncbi:hypothetical protein EFV68_18575 [Yersinia enterocolitica]|nr:hypothetical protein [Yersinia enterocolitica]